MNIWKVAQNAPDNTDDSDSVLNCASFIHVDYACLFVIHVRHPCLPVKCLLSDGNMWETGKQQKTTDRRFGMLLVRCVVFTSDE